MKKFFKRKDSDTPQETVRKIRANDAVYNGQFNYANNYISTTKYNVFTFLPKNLFEQFQRVANAYFLVLLILQVIPQISSLTPVTTVIPLVVVLTLTAIKDAIDDYLRYKSDKTVNNRLSVVLRNGEMVQDRWCNVVVGDVIKLNNDDFVAADLLLLSSSEPHSLCYIETADLDGETNLKVRQALPDTAEHGDDIARLAQFNGLITCEPPNNKLNKYDGRMEWHDKTYSLDNDKILLRGCRLRNTRWCFGLVIFAGKDTKLMQNSGRAKLKRTHIDRLMNTLIIGIFFFLLAMCLFCTIGCGIWESMIGYNFQTYLPWEQFIGPRDQAPGATIIASLVFFSYIIVLNTVVPISLYVSVEAIRLVQSRWIHWDHDMYHEKTDTPAKARTTKLNEELGQIQYIFSDKTGTLTQNIMTFDKCTINGKIYGIIYDSQGNEREITDSTPRVDLSANPYYEKKFDWHDRTLLDAIERGDEDAHLFFELLCICHTVMPEERDGELFYQAQSPDEGALVSAARNFGFVFKSRTPNTITSLIQGREVEYELLNILDFNNVRKRMSVIVRRDGQIRLYCKGADSVIEERLHEDSRALMAKTTEHLNKFASEGLRTLCGAVKDISADEYESWQKMFHEASISLEDRDLKLEKVYEDIERNLLLCGATAIEDKLQDGVPETIEKLARADIKIWVLTGDKTETAINIGYSCRLLTDEMTDVFIVDEDSLAGVEQQLLKARSSMQSEAADKHSVAFRGHQELVQAGVEAGGFALVINGQSLHYALEPKLELLFLEIGCSCRAVICCRVTPLQKAMVVDLVKKHKKAVTLAIGDGANDVSMIKAAHIGVGISGQEGMQAVLASDYAFAQFMFLQRLLLVHGRWSYFRICKFLRYFFYKNFAFTLGHFWFAFFCGFSAQTLYDQYFISFYNLFYTSLPVLAMGVFDQDVSDKYSLRYPRLYVPGHTDSFFNKKIFAISLLKGIIHSLALFFIPYGAYYHSSNHNGQDIASLHVFAFTVATCLIVVVTLQCGLDTAYWTGVNHFVIWGSLVFFFALHFLIYANFFHYYEYVGTDRMAMGSAVYWFTVLLTSVVLLLPVVAYRFYKMDVNPTLTDIVRMKQRLIHSQSKSSDFTSRVRSSMGRSRASLRSGYAFSHQEGFGRLIKSGAMMRSKETTGKEKKVPAPAKETRSNSSEVAENESNDVKLVKFVSKT